MTRYFFNYTNIPKAANALSNRSATGPLVCLHTRPLSDGAYPASFTLKHCQQASAECPLVTPAKP
ncbi:MAG TPA: hypothetical protein VFL47_13455, partial [Flavisolibacter sp.]|nr:hypothetical protein [Flavisolibacter sp.]